MTTKLRRSAPEIQRLVERSLRNWELARSQRRQPADAEPAIHPFLTISRQLGSGGARIAESVADQLGWAFFDRELLAAMADDDEVRRRLYESMDERDVGWLEEMIQWVLLDRARPHDYVKRLTRTVLALVRGGPAVFLGRGVDLILPRDTGLRVRVIAPEEQRVAEFTSRGGGDARTALKEVRRIEHDREEFTRKHFRRDDPWDPLRFDIILNTETVTIAEAARLLTAACSQRVQPGRRPT